MAEHSDRRSVEQYRSLCLLALGRGAEAQKAIEALVTADPAYRPGDADASPRVRATFAEVRRRLLPEIAVSRYAEAKAAYDRGEWTAAEEQFEVVLLLLDDPDAAGRLPDLRMLAAGFHELSARAVAPPPAAPAPPPAEAEEPSAPPPTDAPTVAPDVARIYAAEDEAVSPPAVIRQDLPAVPNAVMPMARARGLMEVVIDEQGRVVSMRIRGSIHPAYDTTLLAVARDWKYVPATLNGDPVRFRKLIQVVVKR